MKNLSLNNSILIFLVILASCSTTRNYNTEDSFFLIKNESDGAAEVVLTPDRILLQCVDMEEDPDEGGRYLFMIQMLDEENTVATSMWGPRPDKKGCENIFRKVNRILKKAKRVYIGSWNNLTTEPRVENRRLSYEFPRHGTFYDNGRVIQFGVITNDKGECFNSMAGKDEPCLQFPFPLEKYEKRLKSK